MSKEIEALQKNHSDDLLLLEEVRLHETELVKALKDAELSHAADVEQLRASHEEAIQAKTREVDSLLNSLKADHHMTLTSLRAELEAVTAALDKARQDHEAAFGKLQVEHEKVLQAKLQEANTVLKQTLVDHDRFVAKIQTEHSATLRETEEKGAAALQATEEEYYNALTKLRSDHAEAIKSVATETNATIERLRQEHAGELRMAEISRDGSLSESESARTLALTSLQEEHAAAIARKETAFAEELESLNAGYIRTSKAKDDDHTLQMDRLKLEHETTLSKLKSDWRIEVERAAAALTAEKDDHATGLQKLRHEHDAAIQNVREQQAAVLQEIERSYQEEIASLKKTHNTKFRELTAKGEAERSAILEVHTADVSKLKMEHQDSIAKLKGELTDAQEQRRRTIEDALAHRERLASEEQSRESILQLHTEEVLKLRMKHEQDIANLEKNLVVIQEQHHQVMEDARAHSKSLLEEEKTCLKTTIAELQQQHAEERETFHKDRDLLIHEIEAHKAAADEFASLREQTRKNHEFELEEQTKIVTSMAEDFVTVTSERDGLENEVTRLRTELDKTRNEQSKLIQEASRRESLVGELERHRSVLAELQENLQKVKDEKDILQTEKNRSDTLVRELQAQLARSASPPNARSPERSIGFQRGTNLPAIKLPPPTPPPSVPPPPAPRSATTPTQHVNGDSNLSTSSQGSAFTSSVSSRESQPESPSTSISHMTPINGFPLTPVDPKVGAKLEQQTKQLEEQEAMIKTLNKQLSHCETDLQTHMDLVNSLETSLGDSEKNCRLIISSALVCCLPNYCSEESAYASHRTCARTGYPECQTRSITQRIVGGQAGGCVRAKIHRGGETITRTTPGRRAQGQGTSSSTIRFSDGGIAKTEVKICLSITFFLLPSFNRYVAIVSFYGFSGLYIPDPLFV